MSMYILLHHKTCLKHLKAPSPWLHIAQMSNMYCTFQFFVIHKKTSLNQYCYLWFCTLCSWTWIQKRILFSQDV